MGSLAILILAAGKGTRMKSRHAKVLHRVGGLPMLTHVVRAAAAVGGEITVVVGHEAGAVMEAASGVGFVRQEPQLGTGHAVLTARKALGAAPEVLVLPGDAPLVTPALILAFLDFYRNGAFDGAVLTARLEDPEGYGRVIRRSAHEIDRIVEERDATAEIREIREVNTAITVFRGEKLFGALDRVRPENDQKEYYLTDVVGILSGDGARVGAFEAPDPLETRGINSRADLSAVDRLMRRRKVESLMSGGVTIMDPDSAWIDTDVEIGADSIIHPSVAIEGRSELAGEVTVRSFCRITNTRIGSGSTILEGTIVEDSEIHRDVQLGPSARLRPGAVLEDRVRVGNFVEIKNSRLGEGTKAGHLAYLGDTETGRKVNFSAGAITCNYDGQAKHRTTIGDGAFIGSGSQLIAPVRIGKGAYVAAGSTITEDVPAHALAIGRGRQVNKKDRMKKPANRRLAKKKPAEKGPGRK